MSRHAAIELDWADGTYTFRLAIDQYEELERLRDSSLYEIMRRLSPTVRDCRLPDIRETLRLGLIGGGMKPVDALVKVRTYIDQRPIDENRDAAYAVVMAGLARVHSASLEQQPGESAGAMSNASTSPESEARP